MQLDKRVFKELIDLQKKLNRNTICLYPNCNGKPIGSHVISEATLKLIADKSHVLTWIPSFWDLEKAISAGRILEQMDLEPSYIGITRDSKTTRPLFCEDHDGSVFAPLEHKGFSFQPEQIVLLAYRVLCSKTFSKSLPETIFTEPKLYNNYLYSLRTLERLRGLPKFQPTDIVLKTRHQYAQILLTQDYNQLDWAVYPVNVQPCIASTNLLIPPVDNTDARDLTVEDVISFSFLPQAFSNNSICVISWLKGSKRAQQFITKINQLPEKEQQDLFLQTVFESSTVYISPIWWESLTVEKREEYKKLHFAHSKEYSQLA